MYYMYIIAPAQKPLNLKRDLIAFSSRMILKLFNETLQLMELSFCAKDNNYN